MDPVLWGVLIGAGITAAGILIGILIGKWL